MTDPTLPLDVAKSGLDAFKPMAEAASEIFVNLFGGIAKAKGDYWEQKARLKQEANLKSFERKVLGEISLEKQPLEGPADLNFAVQLFEAVRKVDDSILQDMWARLLVSSVKEEKHRHPAYIPILSQLSAPESLALREMLNVYFEYLREARTTYVVSFYSVWTSASRASEGRRWNHAAYGQACDNLIRLGLIRDESVEGDPLERPMFKDAKIRDVYISVFGIDFTSACMGLS